MARRPEPWYWKAKRCWYVQVGKKQVRLGPDEEEARRAWHRLMATEGKLSEDERRASTVPEVVDLFLDQIRATCRPATFEKYTKYLGAVARHFRDTRMDRVRVQDIVDFISRRASWRDGTRWGVWQQVATVFKYARNAGFLEFNPLAGFKNPWVAPARERGMTDDEYKALMAAIRDPELRLLLRVLRLTGCRPGEAYKLEAKHLHPLMPIATLAPHEHKTGGRTGKPRYIIFPEGLMREIREAASKYPSGPILRNTKGRPWNGFNVTKRFSIYRKRLGLPKEVVPYSTRHAFITDMVHSNPGQPLPILAKIVGHANANTLQNVYFHPDMLRMIGVVNGSDVANPGDGKADNKDGEASSG
jgi:integrase